MQKKKLFGLMLAVGVLGASVLPTVQISVAKADETDLADQSFLEFVLSDTDYQGEIEFTHFPLYNEDLEAHGRQYDFTIGEVEGYALMVEIQGANTTFYEVEELFYSADSPFDDCDGYPVYIAHRVYLTYKNNAFYDLSNGATVDLATVEEIALKGFGYSDGSSFTDHEETINYTRKTTEEYTIPFELPNIFGSLNGITSCANNAGIVVIVYYDRFFEGLIPNYQSYVQIGPVIRYRTGTSQVFDLGEELYVLMETDVQYQGTTFAGFQNGMRQYVESKGYTYSTMSLFTNGVLNMVSYKSAVQNGKPVPIFLSGYAYLNGITESENSDLIESSSSVNGHVVVGCGYKIDTYYNANDQVITTRTYLKVATGHYAYGIGYLNINGLGCMDKAISVAIN